jgi:prevent-host-death family protein
MAIVTAAEIQKNFAQYSDVAAHETVVVTAPGKPTVVVIAIEEYERLKDLDRRVLRFEEMTDAQIAEMLAAEIPEEYRYNSSDIPD